MASKFSKKWIIIPIVLVVVGVLAYKYWESKQSNLPAGIAAGNGRIEAKLSDASAKEPLRVKEVLVDEGDLVRPGQVLVRLDTVTIDAELAKNEAAVGAAREEFAAATSTIAAANADIAAANADVTGAKADVASANAAIEQQQSEIQLAQTEADRQRRMLAENATSKALFDVRQTALQTAKSSLKDLQARADAAQARVAAARAKEGAAQAKSGYAQARADAAKQQIGVALAQVDVTKSRIKDATLISPVTGRVLYRLVEPGEVLGPGGKSLTLVDLSDVYMEIFLPSNQAAQLKTGAPARITVDYEPNSSAAAYVSFVSPEAQFTPKQVETKSEREKLMFRVKIQVPPELVEHYVERIKTGVRGVGYVKVSPNATWPDWLEKGLINPTSSSALESPHSSGTSK
jgi:HlyD family secretion protein